LRSLEPLRALTDGVETACVAGFVDEPRKILGDVSEGFVGDRGKRQADIDQAADPIVDSPARRNRYNTSGASLRNLRAAGHDAASGLSRGGSRDMSGVGNPLTGIAERAAVASSDVAVGPPL
jgi:hypothetical protein